MGVRRVERLVRSALLGWPFPATNLVTRYDIEGREQLEAALERRARTGRGLVTISNHQSLFDDPIVLCQLARALPFTVESKVWWSTPCECNFRPCGGSPKDRFVRYFSDVANMVFFERPGKNGHGIRRVEDYVEVLRRRVDPATMERFAAAAAADGLGLEAWLGRFVTPGDGPRLAALNQAGMVESLARVETGDWLHFFPEGGRSRTLQLRAPKRGVGKVLYHCPDVDVIPICFYGMHDVLPVDSFVPRPLRRVAVTVGEPVPASRIAPLRAPRPSPETFEAVVAAAWESVVALRPRTLARYLGPARAEALLRAEAPADDRPTGELVGIPTPGAGRRERPRASGPRPAR